MNLLRIIKNNIPNAITCLNLLSGTIACIFAFHSNEIYGSLWGYQWAFIMIASAAVFDFCDGFAARLLHAVSPIGKELDSLSDSVSFGLAPAFLVLAMLQYLDSTSPFCYVALLIAVFGALRLARFNVDESQATSFLGLPIPANAIFWIGFCNWAYSYFPAGAGYGILMISIIVVMSLLMVCHIRMFSLKFKNLNFIENLHRYILIFATVAFIAIEGISGLAWTILFYIILSAIPQKKKA